MFGVVTAGRESLEARQRRARLLWLSRPTCGLAWLNYHRAMRRSVPETQAPLDPFDVPDSKFHKLYYFKREDVVELARLMEVPEKMRVPLNRCCVPGVWALLYLLYRYHTGGKHDVCAFHFHISVAKYCSTVLAMEDFLFARYACHLGTFHPGICNRPRLSAYAKAVAKKGCPWERIWAFIDGSKWEICRPSGEEVLQQAAYTGKDKMHCVAIQMVLSPGGMIQHLLGGQPGRDNDLNLLDTSDILQIFDDNPGMLQRRYWLVDCCCAMLVTVCCTCLRFSLLPHCTPVHFIVDTFRTTRGMHYKLLGDSIYVPSRWMDCPLWGELSEAEHRFNRNVSRVRIAVEWGFGRVLNTFPHLQWARRLRLRNGGVNITYSVAAFLCNVANCIYGGLCSTYFECDPPELADYLACFP